MKDAPAVKLVIAVGFGGSLQYYNEYVQQDIGIIPGSIIWNAVIFLDHQIRRCNFENDDYFEKWP